VATDPVSALRCERSELLTLCQGRSDADWKTESSAAGIAGQTNGVAVEFREWATQRASRRVRNVNIDGDAEYGARFLDAVNVV
jgi:hypothetical protein